jgi:2-amino-4-hydroxy-6-hydroxymethyldihydropteridine diphosphokinase
VSDLVYIGLGSNLGDRERNLRDAVAAFSRIDAAVVLACSSLYDSAPVGPPQPRYLNAVAKVDCELSPQRLLVILKQIETDLGRVAGSRWTARPIDLDILLWDGQVIADPNLQVPHLELHKRRFALEPLCELAPDAVHPLLGSTMRELLGGLPPQDIIRVESSDWPTPPP